MRKIMALGYSVINADLGPNKLQNYEMNHLVFLFNNFLPFSIGSYSNCIKA